MAPDISACRSLTTIERTLYAAMQSTIGQPRARPCACQEVVDGDAVGEVGRINRGEKALVHSGFCPYEPCRRTRERSCSWMVQSVPSTLSIVKGNGRDSSYALWLLAEGTALNQQPSPLLPRRGSANCKSLGATDDTNFSNAI